MRWRGPADVLDTAVASAQHTILLSMAGGPMRFRGWLRRALLCLAAAAAVGCDKSGTGPVNPPSPNYVHLQSDNGDYIGIGQTYNYTHADAVIRLTASGGHVSISIEGDQWWFGDFQSPSTLTRLQPGNYTNLQRGELDWSGEGRGCNTLSGWFAIDSVTYAGDSLTAIDLRFEQHCEDVQAALHGTIHWRADDTTRPPGPVNPAPGGLWAPAPGSTPSAGSFIYLRSDAGDWVGAGQTYTYTAGFAVTTNAGHVSVSVDAAQWWYGDFQTMNTLTRLEPGYYPDLRRYPFHNPVKGGLDWSGEGRGCNTLLGWFAVDRVTYTNGTLTALDLRFEQHCEGGTTALHGVIRWDR